MAAKDKPILQVDADPATIKRIAQLRAELEEVKAKHAERVRNDPVRFVNQRLNEKLWSKQREILTSIKDNRLTTVRSCHASGKSWTVVRAVLWQEIRKAHAAGKLPGTAKQVEWTVDGHLMAQGIKPDDTSPDAFQGIHAEHLLVVLDEANGIPPALWNAALSLATSKNSRIIAIGNPDDPHGYFANTHAPASGWHQIRISYKDTPNFTGEDVPDEIRSVLIGPEWLEDAKRMYGEGSSVWMSKVEGEFPEDTQDSLISLSQARDASYRNLTPKEGDPHVLGVDVARGGSDKTIIVQRRGPKARIYGEYFQQDTMETAGRVKLSLAETGAVNAAIGADGLGAGVFDRLLEQGIPVQELRGGFQARDNEHFANRRAEWYWGLRERFETGDIDIPEDDELLAQLTSIKWKLNSRGQILLESKDDMRKRGLPSPDKADALAYAFAAWDMGWDEAYDPVVVSATPITRDGSPNPWAVAYDIKKTSEGALQKFKGLFGKNA